MKIALTLLLLACPLTAEAASAPPASLEPAVVQAVPVLTSYGPAAFVLTSDGAWHLSTPASARLGQLGPVVTSSLLSRLMPAGDDPLPAAPVTFTTAVPDPNGKDVHHVLTDCKRFGSLKACAKVHKEAVDALKEIFGIPK